MQKSEINKSIILTLRHVINMIELTILVCSKFIPLVDMTYGSMTKAHKQNSKIINRKENMTGYFLILFLIQEKLRHFLTKFHSIGMYSLHISHLLPCSISLNLQVGFLIQKDLEIHYIKQFLCIYLTLPIHLQGEQNSIPLSSSAYKQILHYFVRISRAVLSTFDIIDEFNCCVAMVAYYFVVMKDDSIRSEVLFGQQRDCFA